ncbi:hypothetical protein HMSSN139_36920 [Paenibacillus sp. HMSSN-139]|nr:hypothetical protein HMSSN139_36920 [Paenibacillus sp. HMSSN-139]
MGRAAGSSKRDDGQQKYRADPPFDRGSEGRQIQQQQGAEQEQKSNYRFVRKYTLADVTRTNSVNNKAWAGWLRPNLSFS